MTEQQEMRFDLHAMRYGEVFSADMESAGYTEDQCGECPHEHRCCDLIVKATPAEAAGILQWIPENHPDKVGIIRAVSFRAGIISDHFKKFGKDAINTWFGKRMKCVFYDKEKKACSIYPVRPLACRRVYGAGNCDNMGTKDPPGFKVIMETPQVLTSRVARFKIHPDLNQNLAELTSLVAILPTMKEVSVDQEFYKKDPVELTDDQVIFGLAGAPIQNPLAQEADNGRP